MYPKKKYAPTGGYVVVENALHEEQLGAGWQDNPRPVDLAQSTGQALSPDKSTRASLSGSEPEAEVIKEVPAKRAR